MIILTGLIEFLLVIALIISPFLLIYAVLKWVDKLTHGKVEEFFLNLIKE